MIPFSMCPTMRWRDTTWPRVIGCGERRRAAVQMARAVAPGRDRLICPSESQPSYDLCTHVKRCVLSRQCCRIRQLTQSKRMGEDSGDQAEASLLGSNLAPLAGDEVVVLRLRDLGWQRSTPFDSKLFIYNRCVIPQAECRGFDPRLPLHVFKHLQPPGSTACSVMLPFLLRLPSRRRRGGGSQGVQELRFDVRVRASRRRSD